MELPRESRNNSKNKNPVPRFSISQNAESDFCHDIPNEATLSAFAEAERISKDPSVKGYTDLETLFRDLKN